MTWRRLFFSLAYAILIVNTAHAVVQKATKKSDRPHRPASAKVEHASKRIAPRPCTRLTPELLNAIAFNAPSFGKTVLVAMFDKQQAAAFAASWTKNVVNCALSYWLVGALDPEAASILSNVTDYRCFKLESDQAGMTVGAATRARWGGITAAKRIAEMGFDVVLSEPHVIWMQNPLQMLHKMYASFALTLSTHNITNEKTLKQGANKAIMLNTGVMYVRSAHDGALVLERLEEVMAEYHLPAHALSHALNDPRSTAATSLGEDAKATVGLLPTSIVPNSYAYLIRRKHEGRGAAKPYAVLFDRPGLLGGLAARRWEMREAGLMHEPASYFGNAQSYLTMDVIPPSWPADINSWADFNRSLAFHTAVVGEQLSQVYAGMFMALSLDRTFVMPKMWCFCAPSGGGSPSCRAPGDTTTRFPYTCSITELMRVKRLSRGLRVMDKMLRLREHSFLDNARTWPLVKKSRSLVMAGAIHRELRFPRGPMQIYVPCDMTDKQARGLLARYARTRVLHFPNVVDIITKIVDSKLQRAFETAFRRSLGSWCCGTAPSPGATPEASDFTDVAADHAALSADAQAGVHTSVAAVPSNPTTFPISSHLMAGVPVPM